mmetsp:Transcript_32501/g.103703  ORF Transcript_32501/g.103703 Transcript_32501/m.103703 type:complete len:200 (-) Transcript_32501:329-928(-)
MIASSSRGSTSTVNHHPSAPRHAVWAPLQRPASLGALGRHATYFNCRHICCGRHRRASAAIILAPMPPAGSHWHPELRPGAERVHTVSIRRHLRGPPLLRLEVAPLRLQQRHRGHGPPSPRSSSNNSLAYAIHRLPPHPDLRPGAGGVAAASNRRRRRGQPHPTPRNCAPPPPAAPPTVFITPVQPHSPAAPACRHPGD